MHDNPVTLRVYDPTLYEQENDMRACKHCGCTIPEERLEVFPDIFECVNCSTAEKPRGIMTTNMSKGCGMELTILPNDPEIQRIANRFHKRSR
jgi:hypothetical protein